MCTFEVRFLPMQIKCFFILLLSLGSTCVIAQENSTKVEHWIAKAQTFSVDEADSTRYYLHQIKAYVNSTKDIKAKVKYYLLYGKYCDNQNQYDSALYYVNASLTYAKANPEYLKYEGLAYSFLAGLYEHTKNHKKALEYQMKSIAVSEKLNDQELFIDYHILGGIYGSLKNDSLSLMAYEKSIALSPENHAFFQVSVNINLFGLYTKLDMFEKAARAQKKVNQRLNDPEILDEYTKAIWYLNQSEYYSKIDKVDKAFAMLNQGKKIAERLNLAELDMYVNAYSEKFYRGCKNFEQAYEANQAYYKIRDSLTGVEVQNNLNQLQTKYATAEKERKITEQQLVLEEAESRQQTLFIVISGILVITILLVYFYINSRKKRVLLASKNVKIQQANAEIENLMRESHHRIKNNLQVISSLLKMQSKSVSSAETKASLLDAFNRIKTIAMLHQKLQGTDNFAHINLKEFLNQLIHAIKTSMTLSQCITFTTNIESIDIDTDKAISLGLIVNELLTNTLKYAFENSQEGTVEIVVKLEKGLLHLSIADNGKGLPADFEMDKLTSLGFKIVRSMATKLKADLHAQNNNGAVVKLNMPYERVA